MFWSGGKDSTLALWKVLQQQKLNVKCLVTTISMEHQRISMHGVQLALLKAQAESIGIPLKLMELPDSPDNQKYEKHLVQVLEELKQEGIETVIFGDIFLEDLKEYRLALLSKVGMQAVFPIWKQDTTELLNEFIEAGFKALTVCVDGSKLTRTFAGRILDDDFLNDLPDGVDPCGENGEFHSFVFDGPLFNSEVPLEVGETIQRSYKGMPETCFYFTELKPKAYAGNFFE